MAADLADSRFLGPDILSLFCELSDDTIGFFYLGGPCQLHLHSSFLWFWNKYLKVLFALRRIKR